MASPMIKTKTPGIYKRGSRYVFSYRVNGRQRWESCRTLEDARRALSARKTDIDRGEYQERTKLTFHEYAREWIERYQGTGKRGFRDETRNEYRKMLDRYALNFFPARTLLVNVDPKSIADFIGWLVKQPNGRGDTLTDKSVRNALGPLMACLASAKREGLIKSNPAVGAALPHRPQIKEDDDLPRPFPGDTMETVVALIHPDHRPMFELLAATGLRRSELLALRVQDLDVHGAKPEIRVRQRTRWLKGEGQVIGALKSSHAWRKLPIPLRVADLLSPLVKDRPGESLVFVSRQTNRPLDPSHLWTRVLQPACSEAGVEWAGFHTFRHTVASRMFAAGRNVVQVQRWLGHHSPTFTQNTYIHLLDKDDLGGPLEPLAGVNGVRTDSTPLETKTTEDAAAEIASLQAIPVLGTTG